MEIDSKPQEMDKLERRIIQLKIESEALKNEDDKDSRKREAMLQQEITENENSLAELNQIWNVEKLVVSKSRELRTKLDDMKLKLESLKRSGDLAGMSELQYGVILNLKELFEQQENQGAKKRLLKRPSHRIGNRRDSFEVDRHSGCENVRRRKREIDKS